ncbi:MAG: c-type cytochrome [Flavobacterium sp.]|nr:MAG: c-type cytochrome [Flavobacterium sp.]
MKSKIILAAFAAFIFSCSHKVVVQPTTPVTPPMPVTEVAAGPTPEPSAAPSPESVAKGKELYNNNCGKCHKLFDTKEFSAQDWEPILKRMQRKARLTDEDMVFVHDYVVGL